MTVPLRTGSIVVEETGSAELPLLRVSTSALTAVFAPTRGGRLLALAVHEEDGPRELLWQNPELLDGRLRPALPLVTWPASDGGMSSWPNLGGSKTWPAPQGWSGPDEWAGPPDPVLDAGPWEASWSVDGSTAQVSLVSAFDARTGLRITRRFRFLAGETSFGQTIEFRNGSTAPRTWSIWEVCQVRTADDAGRPLEEAAVVVPQSGLAAELDLGSYEGSVRSTVDADGAVLLPIGTGVAKRGYPAASGPVAYRSRELTLRLSTEPPEQGRWPDGGSRVEIWLQRPIERPLDELDGLHPRAHLVELEVLGPLVRIEPGASTSLRIDWSIERS